MLSISAAGLAATSFIFVSASVSAAQSTSIPAKPEVQVLPEIQTQPKTQAQPAATHEGHPCVPVAQVTQDPNLNQDICVSAHVFAVVELADGTRFLDVCPADVPDDQCRFTFVSLRADHDAVGDLRKYRDQQVQVRGILRATHGRMGIVISHMRQFSGGPEKFKPNPRLLRDFNGQSDRMPVRDPNLAASGHHRSFMNTADKEDLPAQKH
jgi:hypothetical protein